MKRADVRRFRQPFAPRHHAAINHPSTQAYSVHFQAPLLKRITRRRNHNSTQAHGELFAPRPSPVGVFLKTLQVQPHSTLSVLAHDVIDDAFNTLASRLNRSRSVRPCVEDVRNESQLRGGALLCAPLNVFGESSKRFDREPTGIYLHGDVIERMPRAWFHGYFAHVDLFVVVVVVDAV